MTTGDTRQHSPVPLLASVARVVAPIADDTTVSQVIERFQQDNTLLALPVLSTTGQVGIISRRELFYSHLAKPFARELYGRKPVATLLDAAPLLLPDSLTINAALVELLSHDPRLENDCFGVSRQGVCAGIVAVADLMMAISRSQSELLNTLEQLSRRICNEVEMARRVQADLLPLTPLRHAGVSVAAGLVNSSEISGDFYDVFPLDEHRLGLLVGDVTGHGVQAGLVTTAAKAGLQMLLDNQVSTPAQILSGINRAILATTKGNLLMTAVVAIIDRHSDTVVLGSAGHPYPYYWHAASSQWQLVPLDPGFPLGFDENADYGETTLPFQAGDRLLLFSDGIQEAENQQGVSFGAEQLMTTLQRVTSSDPAVLRDVLLAAARSFCGDDHFEDDVTLVVAVQEA
ncbi:MAG: SpoIIE family protein phosphatase [Trichlorobacter sp.]|jgi:serine phosphatase RsbU (regulator of sigma subunit)